MTSMDQLKADKVAAVGLGMLFILLGALVNPYTVSLLASDRVMTFKLSCSDHSCMSTVPPAKLGSMP